MKKPTQTDVARLAGVSRATVSYVINGVDTQGITDDTRRRVMNAINELGYVINAGAQALRSGDTKTIGVMLSLYDNPFQWGILNGISREANEAGYKVLLANSALNATQENQRISELAEQRVDGLILVIELGALPNQIKQQLRKSTHPIVEITSTVSDFDYLRHGYDDATVVIMNHLFELGHRHIAFLHGVQGAIQGLDRLNAYRQAFANANLPFDERWVYHCGPSREDAYQATMNILSQPDRPTALLAINDILAIAAIRAAHDLGLSVPNDLSVAGFDDNPDVKYMIPSLTTVGSDTEQIGRHAVQLLVKRLTYPESKRETITAGWQVQVRESTGPVPD
ncbi:MAG: LacI family DNA-binding transcriptional regulator [Anaerolineaceae bacterium]|nr:LacI family DNA-binding transcriptional regulator [Anaerolineaceae bacterium]